MSRSSPLDMSAFSATEVGVGKEAPMTIAIAHDFLCPWCWVGLHQARRLQREHGVTIEWRGYELFPEGMDYPAAQPEAPKPRNKPETPSRLDFLCIADGIEMPQVSRPRGIKMTKAHLACVYARTESRETEDALVEALYRAYWERGESIDHIEVIERVAGGIVADVAAMRRCIDRRCGMDEIVPYDDPAYATGVYNVPTFFIGDERLAEQPYVKLVGAIERAERIASGAGIYEDLRFPAAPVDRPYVVIDMVSTIDGKTVSGTPEEGVGDLGSALDHALMKRIEAGVDAILVGAGSLRATGPNWHPKARVRVVATRSGDLPDSGFFHGGEAYVAVSGSNMTRAPHGAKILRAGDQEIDWAILLGRLRAQGVERLLCYGGSELNAELLRAGLVDELFLTVAPKIKLGRCLPTVAGGEPLDRADLKRFEIVEHHVVGDEIFLRYRAKA